MRKEELDRRSAEMKARMLAQRAAKVQTEPSNVRARKSAMKANQDHSSSAIKTTDSEDLGVLRNRITQLEAENKSLRQEVAALSGRAAQPSRSTEDSIHEQRHNFFKYSNARRY